PAPGRPRRTSPAAGPSSRGRATPADLPCRGPGARQAAGDPDRPDAAPQPAAAVHDVPPGPRPRRGRRARARLRPRRRAHGGDPTAGRAGRARLGRDRAPAVLRRVGRPPDRTRVRRRRAPPRAARRLPGRVADAGAVVSAWTGTHGPFSV